MCCVSPPGDKLRKPNLQSPAIMAGTQNLQNTNQQYQQTEHESNDDSPDDTKQPPVKEDFTRAPPNSQSNDGLDKAAVADPFDQRVSSPTQDSPENQIQNMTREAGDGQNDNGNENAE